MIITFKPARQFSSGSIGLFFCLALLAVGCSSFLHTRQYLSEIPSVSSLEGEWFLSNQSLKKLKDSGFSKYLREDNSIILKENGECFFKTYWAFQNDSYYIVSNGRWKLSKRYDEGISKEAVIVEIKLKPNSTDNIGTKFYLLRKENKLVMSDFIGDPDYSEMIEFERNK